MAKENIKRVGLYFNLENPIENKMWAYLESKRKKSDEIKRLIENAMNGIEIESIPIVKIEPKENEETIDISKEEIDTNGMIF